MVETMSIGNVKYTLQSQKLKKKVFGSNKDESNLGPVVGRDRCKEKGDESKSN